jgi:hypothetical protein
MSGDALANVFISHASTDSGIADALSVAVDALFEKRVSVSYSTKRADGGIPAGTDWFRWIGEQVKRSPVTVVLITPNFIASPAWLLWETGAVFGTALTGENGQRPRVRPLGFRVDGGELPPPLRAANLQMTSGDSHDEMHQFLGGLSDDFDVVDKSLAIKAGARLEGIVTAYVQKVERLLDMPAPAAPAAPPADPETLQKMLVLTISAMQAFYPSAKMNARYFYASTESGRELLVRDEDVYYESIPMPEEFGLAYVDIERDKDTIVICQSFIQRTPLYRVLPPDLPYGAELRTHVSPSQGWVLACPVIVRDTAKPLGVICLYGEKPPARDQSDVKRLLTVVTHLSDVFCRTVTRSGG